MTGSRHLVEACGKNILVDCGNGAGTGSLRESGNPGCIGRYRLYSPDACTYRSLRKDSDARANRDFMERS